MRNMLSKISAACLCLLILLCSCGQSSKNGNETEISSDGISSHTLSDDANPDKTNDDKNSASPMQVISSGNGIIASGMAGNEQGCYEIFYRPTGDGNIIYTDYATQNRIYLSSQVAGSYHDSTDTSWLESTVGGCYFALTDKNLFLFKLNTPGFTADDSEESRGYIARYDLNGANRQVLTWLDSNETIADGCIVSDSENIYYLEYFINDDGSTTPTILTKLNIRTGEKKQICQLAQDSRHFIVGTYKDKMILKTILNPVHFTAASRAEDIMSAYNQQIHEISLLSANGQQQFVCKWRQDERSAVFANDTMYYWNHEKPGIYQWDFENNSEKCLYSGASIGADGKNYAKLSLLSDLYDNHILATAQESNDSSDSIRFAYDLESNTFSALTLSANERNVEILEEGSQFFLVQTGLKEYPVTDYSPDGEEMVTKMILPEIYLMEKEDYWNNLPNYIPIKENVYK